MRAALLTVLFVVLCGTAQAGTQRLVLHWLPQAQFAGVLMAEEKGFYARRGVDLAIVPGGPDINVSRHLAEGRAEFATMFLSTALERRASGMDLVHIGQIVHQSALMLVARKDSGVRALNDLQGRRVGMWGRISKSSPEPCSSAWASRWRSWSRRRPWTSSCAADSMPCRPCGTMNITPSCPTAWTKRT